MALGNRGHRPGCHPSCVGSALCDFTGCSCSGREAECLLRSTFAASDAASACEASRIACASFAANGAKCAAVGSAGQLARMLAAQLGSTPAAGRAAQFAHGVARRGGVLESVVGCAGRPPPSASAVWLPASSVGPPGAVCVGLSSSPPESKPHGTAAAAGLRRASNRVTTPNFVPGLDWRGVCWRVSGVCCRVPSSTRSSRSVRGCEDGGGSMGVLGAGSASAGSAANARGTWTLSVTGAPGGAWAVARPREALPRTPFISSSRRPSACCNPSSLALSLLLSASFATSASRK
mmetsp:Transcript_4516/g.11597  ORF Transcript_4516/g.11597 Transcript_4516/m.11597 type:complete len:292 (+) Transcript_4516:117-992(+)